MEQESSALQQQQASPNFFFQRGQVQVISKGNEEKRGNGSKKRRKSSTRSSPLGSNSFSQETGDERPTPFHSISRMAPLRTDKIGTFTSFIMCKACSRQKCVAIETVDGYCSVTFHLCEKCKNVNKSLAALQED